MAYANSVVSICVAERRIEINAKEWRHFSLPGVRSQRLAHLRHMHFPTLLRFVTNDLNQDVSPSNSKLLSAATIVASWSFIREKRRQNTWAEGDRDYWNWPRK